MHFDSTGKVSLDHIYTQPDPRAYFQTLGTLDYHIPQIARPHFVEIAAQYRAVRQAPREHVAGQRRAPLKILDVGSSYGINAALLRFDITMDLLYERYAAAAGLTRAELLAHDRELVRSARPGPPGTNGRAGAGRGEVSRAASALSDAVFVGLDASRDALSYACAAGFLDDAVHADLEANDPSEQQRRQLAGADLVISTGCLGYVGERTISRILAAADPTGHARPWMAHFVLRMFPFDAIGESLAEKGYETVVLDRAFRQRRFASAEEQRLVLDSLRSVGVDPTGLETDGWLYAQLHVSRPQEEVPPAAFAAAGATTAGAGTTGTATASPTTASTAMIAGDTAHGVHPNGGPLPYVGDPPGGGVRPAVASTVRPRPSRSVMTANALPPTTDGDATTKPTAPTLTAPTTVPATAPAAATRRESTPAPQWSTTGTFANEDRLPRVPLPTLDDTCARFLEWCSPLLTPDQLAVTEDALARFARPDGPGRALHAELERYNGTDGVRSWLDAFWASRYLGRRDRIALNANFLFLFEESDAGQVSRAAGLVAAALDYKLRLDAEAIEPIIQRGQALSMEQNKYLFATTRIPGQVQDTVRAPYSDREPGASTARHVVVFYRGNIFRMDVVGPDSHPHTLDDLEAGLVSIMEAGARRATPDTAVGQLTTKARAAWATSRDALIALDPANAAALDTIETALFCLCLEDFAPQSALKACDNLLHGDSGNRWFDKSISLIVFADGSAGINVEHCGLDGTTVLSFVDDLLGTPAAEHSARSGARPQGLPAVEPVRFTLDDTLRADVLAAGAAFTAYGAATATATMSFDDFGSDRAKSLRISPDAFVQLAYQLAHNRSKGLVGATYESIATRQFRRGRTEAMRVLTPEIQTFVRVMDDPGADTAARLAALRAAAERHVARARDCQQGRAPEQHLWELQLIQSRRGAELGITEHLDLFDTPGWLVTRDDYLSTSSAPSTHIQYFGFGSTSSKCIGIAYVLLPDRFNIYLSTPEEVAAQMYAFAGHLRTAVRELQDLLAAG